MTNRPCTTSARRLLRARGVRAGRGFTLIELLMSLAILAILLVAAESAVLLSSRAIPNARSLSNSTAFSRQGLDAINAELMFAESAPEITPTSITFTVADRTGDGQPETIRYAWSGTAGDPLKRQYQTDPTQTIAQAAAVTVVENVHNFALAYDRRTTPAPQTYSEGVETLLYANDPNPSLLGGLLGGGLADLGIASSSSVAQSFSPSLPANASGYRVTRVLYKARTRNSNNGVYNVQLLASTSGTATGPALVSVPRNESSLESSYTWQTVTFTGAPTAAPTAEQAVGIAWVSDTHACDVQYQSSGLLGGVLNMVTGSSSGGLLSGLTGSSGSLLLYVYGTVSTPDPPADNYYLLKVGQSLQVGADPRSSITAACRTLNEPQVTGP